MSNRAQCKFFNSPSGCFYGASCRFSHDPPIQQVFSGLSLNGGGNNYHNNNNINYHHSNKNSNSNGYGQKPLCKYFPNCMYSSRCPFYHPYEQPNTYPSFSQPQGTNDYYFDDSSNFEDTVYYPLPRNDIAPPADGSSPISKLSTPDLLLKVLRYIDNLGDAAHCMSTNKAMKDALKSKDAGNLVWKGIATKEMPGCEAGGEPEGGWMGFLKDFCRQSDFINDVYGAIDNTPGASGEDFEDFEDDITVYERNNH
eukprot:TRINITY_DN401_c0_g2_i1.p1 TRINITY_DN401_c0_g2~~TRINITY_DN401_c0_g2_i1.p1  ORF type:complete len:254 (-),score=45.81 TRINITY_DN401_c0_g2_i1:261-1022(-)